MLLEELERLTDAIERHGLIVTGYKGQPVLNQAARHRLAVIEALRKLDLLEPPPEEPDPRDAFLDAHD